MVRVVAWWCLGAVAGGLPAVSGVAGTDEAARYGTVEAWVADGHRGDIAFGDWAFEEAQTSGRAGRLLASSAAAGGDVDTDGLSFALFAHSAGEPAAYAAATRRWARPALVTGDTLSFRVAINGRSGQKGFSLRESGGREWWNFNAGTSGEGGEGYFLRAGEGPAARDDGQQLGPPGADAVFTFTFTQRERELDWKVERTGPVAATASGTVPVVSGTIADVRFYAAGTTGEDDPAERIYFNNFALSSAPRGDAPLTPGERRLPGRTPSHVLRFADPAATAVEVRHSGDDFAAGTALTKNGDVWELDVRALKLGPGWSRCKFLTDGEWEEGADRDLYLDAEGQLAKPPAVYLTWQMDPTTTMTVVWHNYEAARNTLRYRAAGAEAWSAPREADVAPFPFTERFVHTAEITGLEPGRIYEFEVGGYEETFRFRTAPAGLTEPLTFAAGGDVHVGATPDAVSAAAGARDPLFAVIGGDHAYADGRAEHFAKWYRYFESFFHHLRAPDGRLIPLVVGIGNHEVRRGYAKNSPDFDNSAGWRRRHAPYFFASFPFPGAGQPYGALDFGDYLSLLVTDTEHASPLISGDDPQSRWLRQALAERRGVGHVFPVHHVPAYTSHRPFDDPVSQNIRRHWVPLYEEAGVRLVFENHDHTYKRTKPLRDGAEHPDGIIYVGDGAWGIGTRLPATDRPYLEKTEQKHHALLVTLEPDRWQVEAVDRDGEVLDRFGPGN